MGTLVTWEHGFSGILGEWAGCPLVFLPEVRGVCKDELIPLLPKMKGT